ncbi:MAG: secretin N-terminal domain-containing protein, partial [Planctomycetota bacterium]
MPIFSIRFLLLFTVLLSFSVPFIHAQGDADAAAGDMNGRRDTNGETTTLAFNNVTVERLIPFIVESTGKVVIPRQQVLNRRITILSDEPVSQMRAVDLVFLSLQQEGIAVIEGESVIFLLEIADIAEQDLPVIGPDESVLARTDLGTIAQKVYSLTYAEAPSLAEVFEDDDALPEYALLSVDESSNTVVLRGSIALLQQMEQLIAAIDRPRPSVLDIRTFSLKYAEASQVADNIRELYESGTQSAVRATQRSSGSRWAAASVANQIAAQQGGDAFTSENLRVTSNDQQNTVTVLAEKPILENIQKLIDDVWDLPVDEEDVVPRIYDLQHTDPVKVRDILIGLFGQPGARSGRNAGIGRLAGQFSFEPVAESGRLVVVSQTPDALEVIDEIIRGLDQPQSV